MAGKGKHMNSENTAVQHTNAEDSGSLILITGGVRSGKSTLALKLAEQAAGSISNTSENQGKLFFIATAERSDGEMEERVRNHQAERGPSWQTLEEPLDLPGALLNLPANSCAVLDCMSVWLGNVWFRGGQNSASVNDHSAQSLQMEHATESLMQALQKWKVRSTGTLVIVTNEVGWGIVPMEAEVRAWRDAAGRLNQHLAKMADRVCLSVCGIPTWIK